MKLDETQMLGEGTSVLETTAPTIVMAAAECHGFRTLLERTQLEMMAMSEWELASQITIMASEVGVMQATLDCIIKNYRSKVKLENQ